MTTFQIKNMVCPRCVRVVREELEHLGYSPQEVKLGEATILESLTPRDRQRLAQMLITNGFELLTDRDQQLTEAIKRYIIAQVHQSESTTPALNLSVSLEQELGVNYSQLSKLFSATTDLTIEKYYILQRIEKVKELLVYDELSLGEIAVALNYSSTAHLSAQFKKTTGMTPTAFKKRHGQRKGLDQIG